jgi:hypothetical protein
VNSTSTSITVFCGTFSFPQVVTVTGTKPAESGLWNLQASGNGRASGVAAGNVPPAVQLTGTVSGNTVSLETSEGGAGMGTISNGTVTGTALGAPSPEGRRTGTFSGSTSRCQQLAQGAARARLGLAGRRAGDHRRGVAGRRTPPT